jgi:hypothetical protein
MRASLIIAFVSAQALIAVSSAVADDGKTVVSLPRPFTARVIQSGHSLTDTIPAVLERMIGAAGGPDVRVARSTVPGSTMEYRWQKTLVAPDAKAEIGNYEVLVLTERVSLPGPMEWHDSRGLALRWFNHAWENGHGGRGAETILYATWVGIQGEDWDTERHIPWRERLLLEAGRWKQILDHVNAHRTAGSPPMRLIPGTQIIIEVNDKIAAGAAPGLKNVAELFTDGIHLSDTGTYLIGLAHYAVIYGRDPRGLPNAVGLKNPPSPELAAWMQELVWGIVTSTDGTGLKAAR